VQLNIYRKMGIYLMGYLYNPQSSSEYDSAEEECPQLVDFPSIFSSPLISSSQ
jgi:hypothetical protein